MSGYVSIYMNSLEYALLCFVSTEWYSMGRCGSVHSFMVQRILESVSTASWTLTGQATLNQNMVSSQCENKGDPLRAWGSGRFVRKVLSGNKALQDIRRSSLH